MKKLATGNRHCMLMINNQRIIIYQAFTLFSGNENPLDRLAVVTFSLRRWLSFLKFFRGGKTYCYANFCCYSNFSTVFGQNFMGTKVLGGKLLQGDTPAFPSTPPPTPPAAEESQRRLTNHLRSLTT